MGASLSVDLSQVGVNQASRTATVSIVIKIISTGGTHNNYGSSGLGQGALLYVTIDGSTYSQYVTFGSSSTGTFTSTVYSDSITVSYGSSSTKTVFVNARCITGTSAGTISGSDSISLTPIGSSGGSGGSGGSTDNGDNSEEYDDSPIIPNTGNLVLVPGNATIWGQCHQEIMYGGWDSYTVGNSTNVGSDFHPTYGTKVYYVTVIGFTTPEITGVSTAVRVALDVSSGDEMPVNIALCTSDENRSSYIGASDIVNDENQIATGSITLKGSSFCFTTIPATGLISETNYYLILWSSDKTKVKKCVISNALQNAISVDFISLSVAHIGNSNGSDKYHCYIDNQSKFDAYAIYIDNGAEWEML